MQTATERFESQESQSLLADQLLVEQAGHDAAPWETLDQFGDWSLFHQPFVVGALPQGPSTAHMGAMKDLPEEVLQLLVDAMDPATAESFRGVNRKAFLTVEGNMIRWRMRTEAVAVWRAALSLRVRGTCLRDLFAALSSTQCCLCGDFAGLLYLMTADRVCWSCMVRDETFWPLTYTHSASLLGVSTEIILDCLPCQSMPQGVWGPFSLPGPPVQPTYLVDRAAVRREFREDLDDQGLNWKNVRFSWATTISAPVLTAGGSREGVYCWACDAYSRHFAVEKTRLEIWHRQFDPLEFSAHMREDHPDVFWEAALRLFPWAERPDDE